PLHARRTARALVQGRPDRLLPRLPAVVRPDGALARHAIVLSPVRPLPRHADGGVRAVQPVEPGAAGLGRGLRMAGRRDRAHVPCRLLRLSPVLRPHRARPRLIRLPPSSKGGCAAMSTAETVLNVLAQVSRTEAVRDHLDLRLYDQHLLDSLATVRLIVAFEEAFAIQFDDVEFERE